MSTSRGGQQIFYGSQPQQRTHSQRIPVSLQMEPHHRQQQIVVVSGNSQCATCVGGFNSPAHPNECPSYESKMGVNLLPVSHSSIEDNKLYSYPIRPEQSNQQIDDDDDGMVCQILPRKFSTGYLLKNKVFEKNAEKVEKDAVKRARQAEAARLRYHRLTPEEKKALNLKRTLAQKRKKQREKEMAELEAILRASGDIYDDPEVLEQLREKRMRAKWAEAARNRYQRMSEDERRSHNMRRRMKQVVMKVDEGKEILLDDDTQRRIKEQNVKKAEAARQRYHRMNPDEKKIYNHRRTEAFRRRRMEEEALLAMPIGRINGEALDRAQQIVIRNAKRAEAARLRYQRMTPEQRRAYNQKRYTPKRKRHSLLDVMMGSIDGEEDKMPKSEGEEEFDALSSLERDVLRRTQQAHQALLRRQPSTGNVVIQSSGSGSTHIIQQPISSSATRQSQQIIVQQPISMGAQMSDEIQQPIEYITTGTAGTTRILIGGNQQQKSQPVSTYMSASQHQAQRA